MSTTRRLGGAAAALMAVIVVGTIGYRVWGLGWLDAFYQTVSTVTTVGFREVRPFDAAAKLFTILLVLAGVGTVLYTLSVILEAVLEGHLAQLLGRRRMDRRIADVSGHVVKPQEIGGARMAALITHPHVAAFLDVATGLRTMESRIEEIIVEPGSPAIGGPKVPSLEPHGPGPPAALGG